MPSDKDTLQFYGQFASIYVERGAGHVSRHLPPFLERLPANSRILELGCGGGYDARAMRDAGHVVDPTDGTPEMADKAQALLGIPVRVMRFDELDADSLYDGVWANASLLHVPRPALPQILTRIRNALKTGGLHHGTYKTGDAEGRDRFGRYFNYLSPEQLAQMHRQSGGWELLSITEYLDTSYHTADLTPWVAVLARKLS